MGLRLSALLLALLLAGVAQGKMYTWTDENGQVHFSDKKPAHQNTEEMEARQPVNSYAGEGVAPSRLVMYSTSWCGYCRAARTYFRANNIPFTEKDIEASAVAKREYDRLGGTGVPLILHGDTRMQGWNERSFQRKFAD